jgi:hypothetical protein
MAIELNTNNEAIPQNIHEDLRKRKRCAKFVPHGLTTCQDFIQTYQDNHNFLFPQVKTTLKEKRFQDAEDIKKI